MTNGAFAHAFTTAYDIGSLTIVIPPIQTIGPIEARIPEIVACVAEKLNVVDTTGPCGVETSVEAAIIFAIDQTNRYDVGLPDDSLTIKGVELLAERIHLDTPNGAQVAVADPTFEPVFQPENLWKHVRHYFRRLYPRFGIS